AAPADSPLGRRESRSRGGRVSVAKVLPEEGLGQFALRPAQVTRPLVVAPLALVQGLVARGDVANVIFAVPRGNARATDVAGSLRARLAPTLADYGLVLEEAASDAHTVRLTSRRLILPEAVDRAAEAVLAPLGGRPSLVLLANALTTTGPGTTATIPYSTVLGVADTTLPVGDLVDAAGATIPVPGPDQMVIDRWMADDLAAQGRPVAAGDPLELASFLPETVHGRVEEVRVTLRVAGIAEMRGAAVDRSLVPEVEGVSDEDSIADWDPPFPFDAARVRTTPPHDEDDRYWKTYGTTPKAFVPLETARRLAGSRFGESTAWHVPRDRVGDLAALGRTLAARLRPEAVGLEVVPLAAEARAAARGSTPFGPLFLGLSSFVVVAGLLLEWLLFRLLVTSRRCEVGVLAALGWSPRRLATLLALVGFAAAAVGSVVGVCLGPLWARVLLDALARAWTTAVAAGSRQVFGDTVGVARPLGAALVASLVVSVAAVAWAAVRAARARPLALLRGSVEPVGAASGRVWPPIAAAAGAAVLGWLGLNAGPERAVTTFFLSGAAALVAFVTAARTALATRRGAPVASLGALAWRALCGQPSRAVSVIAIVAVAEFLVVALSAFTLGPPPDPADRRSPTGGYALLASFGTPVAAESAVDLGDARVAFIRGSGGGDASCTNLYAALRPTVLGVGSGFVDRGGFTFVAHLPLPSGETNPWTLLGRAPDATGPIPAILDQATAQWALKVGGLGARFSVPDDDGEAIEYEIVGLLAPGILQGFVVVGERSFEAVFPRRSGYSLALLDGAAGGSATEVASRARDAWADAGVTVEPTLDRLARLSAVHNTFLAGFQALGLLGLLLGTAGVAAVQAQGVLERLGQFGLLQALGFAPGRVRGLIALEATALVGTGLVAGVAAGLIALAPALLSGRAQVPAGWVAVTCGLTLAAAAVAGAVASRRATSVNPRELVHVPWA
ncbi:MAG: ABC transporter permease, partial [Planctomycetia bacterium]|nr:ABC transporter permease [Planctomycetia bacterium]